MTAGRPTKFTQELFAKIIELADKGKTVFQISEIIEIPVRTIYRWQAEKDEFRHALNEAKQAADERVEASLYSRACGYSHSEEKIFLDKNGEIVRAATTRHYPPDTISMIFWLKNRQPKKWRDKIDLGDLEDPESNKDLKKMSLPQLLKLANLKEVS